MKVIIHHQWFNINTFNNDSKERIPKIINKIIKCIIYYELEGWATFIMQPRVEHTNEIFIVLVWKLQEEVDLLILNKTNNL